nr:aldehyde dehydrogenase family protein [Chitinophagaceae bacterium]
MKYNPVQNFINGQFVNAKSKNTLAVISPVDGHSLSTVPLSNADDLNDAVQAAQKAFPAWSSLPIKERVQVFFRFKTLLERDLQELAALCTEENGKTMAES